MNPSPQQPDPIAQLTRGYLICFIAAVLWSTTAIFIRYLTVEFSLPPIVLAFWRDLFVFLTIFIILWIFRGSLLRIKRKDAWFMLLYGLILALFNTIWTFSVALNGAAVATVLVYSSPAFTAILGHWIFSERLDLLKTLVILLSIIGCVLVSGAYIPEVWEINLPGIVIGLISGLGLAGYSLMGRASARRSINPWTALTYSFGVATFCLLGFNLLPSLSTSGLASTNLLWLGSSLNGWSVLLILGVLPTLGGFGLYTVSLTYLPAGVANLIATLEPVMTAVLAYIFLNERLDGIQIAGSALILASILFLRIREGRLPEQTGSANPATAQD